MQLCSYQTDTSVLPGIVRGDSVIIPALSEQYGHLQSMQALIEAGDETLSSLASWSEDPPSECILPYEASRLRAPIPVPRQNIICLGWNYAEHAIESANSRQRDVKLPEHPIVFTKAIGSVIGPGEKMVLDPSVTKELDWEVELAIIIGKKARYIERDEALGHVFGYTVINDLSARDLQFRHKQYFIGKSLDGACPMGPVIATSDEIDDLQNLGLRSWVNGVLKQDSNTRHQIFDCAEIIHRLSQSMTLMPGDIIATGTPEGVGFARQPPEFLAAGDTVECEVDGIGKLTTYISAA